MGAYFTKFKSNFNADNVFSYTTVKLVKINDRRLGIIHHLLQAAIFIYIVLYTIIYQQRYLLLEAPSGSIRATAKEPHVWADFTTIPYCYQNQHSYNSFENFNCTYMRGIDITYPPGQENLVLVATRIKDTTFTNHPNCLGPAITKECAPPTHGNSIRYYVGDIENYTLYMEHAVFGRQNEIVISNADCDGKLIFRDGSKPKHFTAASRNDSRGDVVTIGELLKAAKMNHLDAASGVPGPTKNSFRYDGALLVTVITYNNYITDPKKMQYTYELYNIPKQDVVIQEPSRDTQTGSTQRNFNGVRFVFLVVGSIGMFDFPTLLTSLVNGTVLLNVASVIVDVLILHIIPEKKHYSTHKFEQTDTFEELKKKKEVKPSPHDSNRMSTPLLNEDYGAI